MPFDRSKVDLTQLSQVSADTELDDDLRDDNLNFTMGEALKVNPDEHANVISLSEKSGIPQIGVQSDPTAVEQDIKANEFDFSDLRSTNPKTADHLTVFDNAVVAQDDVDVLKGVEDWFSETFENIGESLSTGFDVTGKGLLLGGVDRSSTRIEDLVPMSGLPVGMESEAFEMSRQVAKSFGITTDDELARVKVEATDQLITELQELLEKQKELTPEDLSLVQQGVRGGIESLGHMAPGFALMLLSGGKAAPVLVTMGAQTFGASYGEGRAEGLTPEEAGWFASIDTVIEVGTELLPTKTLERIITGESKGLTKKALKFMIQEMGTEQLATLGQTINSYAFGLDEQMENAESIEEMVQIQLQRQAVTAIATVVAGGAQATVASGINKTINALSRNETEKETKSQVEQRKIDELNDLASKSTTNERAKESFRQFVENADGDNNTHVFIDGAQAALYLQSKTNDEIKADPALQILSEQSREAAALGGDVQIPVADFAADVAGTEHFDQLRDSMTLSPETTSPFRQEQVQQETDTYVRNLMDEAQQNVSEYVEAQEIYTQVRDQLVDSGQVTPANASIMAQVVPAWATAQARRQGISVQEVYDNAGLNIEGPQTGERARLEGEGVLSQLPKEFDLSLVDDANEIREVKIDDTTVVLSVGTNQIDISSVRTPIRKRGQGSARKAMQSLVQQADQEGVTLKLAASALDKKTSTDKLVEFYESLGFETTGKTINMLGEPEMVREPQQSEQLQQQPAEQLIQEPTDPDIFKQETDGKEPEARGYYDPANGIIRLTESADLSTFLHEFAHFMYEMELQNNSDMVQSINNWYKRNADEVVKEANKYLAAEFDAEKQDNTSPGGTVTTEDVTAYLDNGTTGDRDKNAAIRRAAIRRAVHEQFARGFETYLMEGKAPSIELRNAFRAFARWLAQIYQALRGDLKVNLDNEMRQVFDRLLATEEQIQAAEARARVEPMFTDAAMVGMTDKEFADYQSRQEKVKDVQSETLRDKLIEQLTRQTKLWWKEEKQDIIDEQIESLTKEKVYTARNRLKSGDIKLDHATVKDMIGEEKTDKIGRKRTTIPTTLTGMTAKGKQGVHPDEAAAFFGYNSGSEMLNDLVNAPKIETQAETNAEAEMVERHGDILNDGTIEREADEAIQSEERGKLILHELKMLARGTNAPTIDRATMKAIAEERIGRLSFREIHPAKYRRAEIRAAQESARMLETGNREGAAEAKLRQVMNYYLGMAATNAKNDTVKIIDQMSRYNKKKVREEIMKAENGYWDQINKILNRFDFRKSATLKEVENINTWAKDRMENDGAGLTLSNTVLNELIVTHWKNIPFADLQGVSDSVKNMEHVARYSNKMRVAQEELDFNKLKADWIKSIEEQDQRFDTKTSRSRTADAVKASAMQHVRRWASQLTKIPFLASWLDGGLRTGISHNILIQPMTDALDAKLNLIDEVASPVMNAILKRSKEDQRRHNQKIWIPEINDHLMGHQVLAVALNVGNHSNLKKLLLGEGWADPEVETDISFDNPQLQAVLKHMTKSDWQLVQLIWDQMEMLYPRLAEVHRRTTGLTPPKVESTPVTVEFQKPGGGLLESVTFNGGYYPVKYSPKRSHRAAKNAEKLEAETESMFNNTASIQASVNASATNERTGFYDRINLSLEVVPDHFNETIHYITHHDAVRQTNRLIQSPDVADAITAVLGEDEFNQLKPWLNDVAKDGRQQPTKTFIDEWFQRLRFGVTLGVMGFKASTGIMQLFGLFTTAAEVGVGPTLKGVQTAVGRSFYMKAVRKLLGSTDDLQSGWEFAAERSKVLPHRAKTMDREIRSALERLAGKTGVISAVQEASMKHIALIQTYMVDLPTWHAAYDKHLSEFNDEVKAAQFADATVENIQGSGATKDMARIVRNQSKITTTFTMFMTFFSSLGNLSRDLVKGARTGQYSKTTIAAKTMFLFTIPVFMEMLMRGQFDEPENDDERMSKFLTNVALYPLASVPFVRDVASGLALDFGYNLTPVSAMLEKGITSSKAMMNNIQDDEEFTKAQLKNVSKLVAAGFAIPGVNQMWSTGEHLYDVIEEGEEFTTRELLFGPDRE